MTWTPDSSSSACDGRLSRRSFHALALGGATALAGVLAGCADDVRSTPAAATGTAAAGRFPVSVRHKFGTTTVEAPPTRVVSVGVTEHDTLLALGVMPVGVTDWYGDQPYATWPWARSALGSARPTVLKDTDGIPFEKVVALRPDLIVGTNAGLTARDYRTLSAIAPTVAQSGDYTDYFEPWDVQSRAIGTALGRSPEVEAVIQGVHDRFSASRRAHPEFEGTRAIFLQNAVYDGNVIAYQRGLSTDFLTDLGLEVPRGLEKFSQDGAQAYIPLEQLPVLDAADVLVWATEKDSDRAALERVPGFARLEAVRSGRSLYTGWELSGAIYFTSPLSLPYVVDRLTPMLAQVL
jgi:iron complex transport system substrate-binding protein